MRKQIHFILSLITCFILAVLSVACQKERAPVIAACGADMSLNKTLPVRRDFLKLRREFAMVRHTDCAGKVTLSRQTVKDPKDAYHLQAETIPGGSGALSVSAFNRTTCDWGTIKPRKSTSPYMEIQVHTSPGTRRTHVLKNADNYIDYEFHRCIERDATGKCLRSDLVERGTLVLFVEYSEFQHPGEFLTSENCPDNTQKKP